MSNAARAGITIFGLQSLFLRLFQLLAQILAAKLLAVPEFGSIGLAAAGYGIAVSVVAFGIDDFIIQRGSRRKLWLSDVSAIALSVGLFATILILMASPLIAAIYPNNAVAAKLLCVMALALPINALCAVPIAKMRGELRFLPVATFGALDVAGLQFVSICLFLAFKSPVAFVASYPLVAIIKFLVLMVRGEIISAKKPKFRSLKHLVGRAKYIVGYRSIISVVGQADIAILAYFANSYSVGLYAFAFKVASQPIALVSTNISNVVFPWIRSSGFQDPTEVLKVVLPKFVPIICCAAGIQILLAPSVFHLIFNGKWDAGSSLIQLLTFALTLDGPNWICSAILMSSGKFQRLFNYALGFLGAFVTFMIVGGKLGGVLGGGVALCLYYGAIGSLLMWRVAERWSIAKAISAFWGIPVVMVATISPFLILLDIRGLQFHLGAGVAACAVWLAVFVTLLIILFASIRGEVTSINNFVRRRLARVE
jgi:O-antigen/teichoic acid export membrane protein